MKGSSKNIYIVIIITSLLFGTPAISQGKPSSIELNSNNISIRVGDPLILKLVYKYEEPLLKSTTREIIESIRHHAYLTIENSEGHFLTNRFPIYPLDLTLKNNRGLEYGEQFVFFYHPGENRLIFPIPGTYTVTVTGYTVVSNPLSITVEPPSEPQRRALSLLSDPNDYFFLQYGEHEYPEKRPERISHLQQVVKQCEGTLLAKWAAARLGLEYFEDFHKKHPSFQTFKVKQQQGEIEEPLFDQAHKYLSTGTELSEEFPIREKVLYQLSRTEVIEGNYEKAFSLLDELATKYPHGEYGSRANNAKKEMERLRELEQATQPALWSQPSFLTFAGAGIAIAVAVLIILVRKKAISRSQ